MGNLFSSSYGCNPDDIYMCGSNGKVKDGNDGSQIKADDNKSHHMASDPVIASLLAANAYCGLSNTILCDSSTIKNLTLARTAQERFLVEHKMDKQERWLLSQQKVSKALEPIYLARSLLDSETENGADDDTIVTDALSLKASSENGIISIYEKTDEGKRISTDVEQEISKKNNMILRLTMRANFSQFYYENYLESFPRQTIEKGVANSKSVDMPNLSKTEEDLIRNVVSFDADIGTSESPRPVRFVDNKSKFLNLSIQGSLGLLSSLNEEGTGLATNAVRALSSKQLVLLDESNRSPVAVCSLKALYGPPIIHIHSPNPSIFCQAPSPGMKFEGRALYPWAEFRIEGQFPLPVRYSLHLAVGNDRFELDPSFRASHLQVGSPDISVVGRSEDESIMRGCCIISLGKGAKHRDRFFISIAKGVDPSIFICFAALVDEFLEHTMRRQNASLKRA